MAQDQKLNKVVPLVTHIRHFLSNHDGCLEVYVDDDEELVTTGLEEEVLDVREQDVCGWYVKSY